MSDKYGEVYVQRTFNTTFPDPEEPVALLRAQDQWSLRILEVYLDTLRVDDRVPLEYRRSVERQVEAFRQWRDENPDLLRVPGTPT
jgi:hypothetical protein